MLFKKVRGTIDHYRTEAESLDPQAFALILGMVSHGTRKGRRLDQVRS